MSATNAKNKIGELCALAANEPVIVEFDGVPRFQVSAIESYKTIPKHEYEKLNPQRKPRMLGFGKELFEGIDTDALLAVDIVPLFEEYI